MPLDPAKLVGAKRAGDRTTAQCPVCAAQGADQHGKNHLIIYPSGKWGCCVDQSPEHTRAIWLLIGDGADPDASTDFSPPPEPTIEIERTWPPSVLAGLIRDHTYWEGRGIPESVLEPLRGGVATRGQLANRYVIPIFGEDGLVHGFTGRALKGQTPKWKHLGKVSTWVWGDLAGIEETGRAVLIEGPGDRLAMDARGARGALVLWGVNLSQAVLGYLIATNPREIVVATNNDVKAHQAGQRAAGKALAVLNKFFDEGIARICLPRPKDLLDAHADDNEWQEWLSRLEPPAASAASDEDAPDAPTTPSDASLDA